MFDQTGELLDFVVATLEYCLSWVFISLKRACSVRWQNLGLLNTRLDFPGWRSLRIRGALIGEFKAQVYFFVDCLATVGQIWCFKQLLVGHYLVLFAFITWFDLFVFKHRFEVLQLDLLNVEGFVSEWVFVVVGRAFERHPRVFKSVSTLLWVEIGGRFSSELTLRKIALVH